MNIHDATEAAYKRGYIDGYMDGRRNEWISCEERLPEKSGVYLAMCDFSMLDRRVFYPKVLSYALCLEHVDEYDSEECKHGGWYAYDSEVGFYECSDAAYWMPLPELPKGVE